MFEGLACMALPTFQSTLFEVLAEIKTAIFTVQQWSTAVVVHSVSSSSTRRKMVPVITLFIDDCALRCSHLKMVVALDLTGYLPSAATDTP